MQVVGGSMGPRELQPSLVFSAPVLVITQVATLGIVIRKDPWTAGIASASPQQDFIQIKPLTFTATYTGLLGE